MGNLWRHMKGKVTILPSSVHELIIFAMRENENVAVYQEMVRFVNESVLAREDYSQGSDSLGVFG